MEHSTIEVIGATLHNLKNVHVQIPRGQLTVITGVSGSGKSTLAFDTLFAEGQRRYVESLSAYVRQFLGLMQKPPVESITGLSPAIAIQQKSTSHNPRSTVGTLTEIHDYLRVLFARLGEIFCPKCQKPILPKTVVDVAREVMATCPLGEKLILLAPLVVERKGSFEKVFEQIKKQGFTRVRIDGVMGTIEEKPKLEKNRKHSLEIVVDRIILKEGIESRLREAIEMAMDLGGGRLILILGGKGETEKHFSRLYSCLDCQTDIPELSPRLFSFNNPLGACSFCEGLGATSQFDPAQVVDGSLSIRDGAVQPPGVRFNGMMAQVYEALGRQLAIDLTCPFGELPLAQRELILNGSGQRKVEIDYKMENTTVRTHKPFPGLLAILQRRYLETQSEGAKSKYQEYMSHSTCPQCRGARLNDGALNVRVAGHSIHAIGELSVGSALEIFQALHFTGEREKISGPLLKEVVSRLRFLVDVGLDYLTLNRTASTLSGGELQRIRLATQIGSGLVGVLYILDEPSIGLHQRDNERLIQSLLRLRDLGNTLLVVEHDEEIMRRADHIVDMGPGAGIHGGEVIFSGPFRQLARVKNSLTGAFLSGRDTIEIPRNRRPVGGKRLELKGLTINNLKNIDFFIPLERFICVTGVSGSGKSSLVNETLWPLLATRLNRATTLSVGPFRSISGLEHLDKAIVIDQSPIGRTPRSNPATYTKLLDEVRTLFAETPEARALGYKAGRFSFNVAGGRCENCEGDGEKKIEMHLLPDVYVKCDICQGKRFNPDTLNIRFKGHNISEVLEMSVEEALTLFGAIPRLREKLETLSRVGLGYIHLGQSSVTLSGGEAQRVKLATELSRRASGRTIYILDEPTTGLHFKDIQFLLTVLQGLVDRGNTVVVVEHNLEVIKCADYIVDLGPEGGLRGGEVVGMGTPEELAGNERSFTGQYLRDYFARRSS